MKCKKMLSDAFGPQCSRRVDALLKRFKLALFGSLCHLSAVALGDKVAQTHISHKRWCQTKEISKKNKQNKTTASCICATSKVEYCESLQHGRRDLKICLHVNERFLKTTKYVWTRPECTVCDYLSQFSDEDVDFCFSDGCHIELQRRWRPIMNLRAKLVFSSCWRYSHPSVSYREWSRKPNVPSTGSTASISPVTPLPPYLGGLLQPPASSRRPPLGSPPERRSAHLSVSELPAD